MWIIPGPTRIGLLILIVALAFAFGKRGRLWLAAVGPLALMAAFVPGNDPLSMLIALALLGAIFGLGAYWGPRLSSGPGAPAPLGENAASIR